MKKLLDENPDADCVLRGKDFEAKDVFDAARSGDALAAREVDEMTDTLGMALASIASTTDPEMFLIGGGTTVWLIAAKLYKQAHALPLRPVTDQPLFYLAMLAVVLGVQLFLAGFLGELVNRGSSERNKYLIDREIN